MLRSAMTMLFMFSLAFSLPLLIDRDGFFRFGAKTALELNAGSAEPLAPGPPVQRMLDDDEQFITTMGDFNIKAVAAYEVDALVMGRQSYEFDPTSAISPTDLALGWGLMSIPENLRDFRLRQRERRSYLSWSTQFPYSIEAVNRNFSNTHMIPADDDVAQALSRVREGDLVQFSGFLVQAQHRGNELRPWTSSFSRDDTNDGACEIVLVTAITSSNSRESI